MGLGLQWRAIFFVDDDIYGGDCLLRCAWFLPACPAAPTVAAPDDMQEMEVPLEGLGDAIVSTGL